VKRGKRAEKLVAANSNELIKFFLREFSKPDSRLISRGAAGELRGDKRLIF